ncbi:ATP-dependent DNA helicase DinG [Spirochaetia bacterium]|nr:ATP-dependent DNA helicase DinG [Spirochaetia bacterium]
MRAVKRFSEDCIKKLRAEIEDAGGNEVYARGFLDAKGLVTRIEIAARGNEESVLALDAAEGDPLPDVLIHNHPSGALRPSENDLNIAGRAAEGGIGSFIVDNKVENVYVTAEPVRRKERQYLEADAITAALEEGGAVARRLPSYEKRDAQLDLMRLIIRSFNEDAIAAAEAGTGVGKSFAYLLPALGFALLNDERIVLSTATITLQQQLFEKDIPLVQAALPGIFPGAGKGGKELKAVLMKGRGNYLCRRRLTDQLRDPAQELEEEENNALLAIQSWAETTSTGSRSDLAFLPPETVWSRVCSEADLCMGMRCPERERCFVLALRREAADARIIVVNHHLLFADLAARHEGAGYDNTVVLPPYNRVIIDEAHTVESSATSFFSRDFSRPGLFRQLGRLYRRRRGLAQGLLPRLSALVDGGGPDRLDALAMAVEKIRDTAESTDQAGLELCGREGVFRLTAGREEPFRMALAPQLITLKKQITALGTLAADMLEKVPEKEASGGPLEQAVWEIKSILRRLDNIAGTCADFIEFKERPAEVMWMERHGGNNGNNPWVSFTVTPLEVAPSLKEALFDVNKTVICVSATLTVADSFAFWASRSGFSRELQYDDGSGDDRKKLMGRFPSPFPYAQSVLLAAPQDAPLPEEARYRSFVDDAVARLVESSGGSALVLFTSYEALRSAYAAARPILEAQGIKCLKQGDDDRHRLLQLFLEDQSSVLFATDSFWEGVDAPGDTLRLVILCRLPFKTPNDPVFEARCEALEKQGGRAFMELSLPEAVMKFKQGFGRLMRRSSDHGVVAVLDGRILRKRYGEFFIRSLPETKTCFAEFSDVLRRAEDFFTYD